MISFIKIVNGFRVRFYRVTFCIGIGTDQLTPVYYKFKNYRIIGNLKQEILNHKKEQEAKRTKKI
jgi:hypothetical protein